MVEFKSTICFNIYSKQEPITGGQGKVNVSRQSKQPLFWDKSYTPPLRSSSSIRHRVFQGYPISSRQKSIPGPWDRPSINSGGRNMGQPPELPPTPLSAQHKVNELTTFPPTSSNQQQRPPANVSALKVAVMFQSRPWFTQTYPITHGGEFAGRWVQVRDRCMSSNTCSPSHLQRFLSSPSSQKTNKTYLIYSYKLKLLVKWSTD